MICDKEKILVVDDEISIRRILETRLSLLGYHVSTAGDGEEALLVYRKEHPNLIILDIMMPKMDGFSLATKIREENKKTPIIFLTAKGMKEDMIRGYESGADDYLTKPFDTDVLLYKINIILKRSFGIIDLEDQTNFKIGEYDFDYKLRQIHRFGKTENLSPKEADLLRLLCVHQNDLLPRQKALKLIWGDDNYFNGRSMDVFVTKLRKYLKDDSRLEIATLHGKGIRLLISQ